MSGNNHTFEGVIIPRAGSFWWKSSKQWKNRAIQTVSFSRVWKVGSTDGLAFPTVGKPDGWRLSLLEKKECYETRYFTNFCTVRSRGVCR